MSHRPSPIAGVALAATIAAIVYTYPLVRHAGEAIPYAVGVAENRRIQDLVPGDHLQFHYYLSLVPRWAAGEIPWFQDTLQFSAPEPRRERTFFFLPFSLVFLAAPLVGSAAAYDLLVWLSFPAVAMATFALGRRLGLGVGGAALAAAAATLLPYRVASAMNGHPAGFVLFLLPLVFACLERAWWDRSPAAAAGAGAAIVALAWNEPHYLYFLGFLLPIWAIAAFFRLGPWHRARDVGASIAALAVAAIGPTVAYAAFVARYALGRTIAWTALDLVLLWSVFVVLLAIAWRLTAELRARAGDEAWAAQARAFLPLVLLVAYGAQAWMEVPYAGRAIMLATAVALAIAQRRLLAALRRLARSTATRDALARASSLWPFALGGLVAAGFVLHYKASVLDATSGGSSGRTFREILLFSSRPEDFFARSTTLLTHQLYPGAVLVALALVGAARPLGAFGIGLGLVFSALALGANSPPWLPFQRLAVELVPFFGWIRQSNRFFVIAALGIALAAGAGVDWLARRAGGGRRAGLLIACAIALVAIDFASLFPVGLTRLPRENRAYAVVAAEARGMNLLELPLWPGDSAFSSVYQYWTTVTGVPIVNGYSPTTPRDYVERVFLALEGLNVGELTEAEHRRLDELRVRFVTLHEHVFPSQVSAFSWRRTLVAMRRNPNLVERATESGVHLFERRQGTYQPFDASVGWPIGAFFEAESLRAVAGRKVADDSASGGQIMRGPTAKGLFLYGPYRPFPPGAYAVRFRVRGGGALDVAAEHGRAILARKDVAANGWEEIELIVDLERARALEFRAAGDSPDSLELDWVLVTSADPLEREAGRIEGEELTPLAGLDRESPEASGGAFAEIGDPAGDVARDGPYRSVRPGRRELVLSSRGGPFLVRVESADARRRYAEIEVAARPEWGITRATVEIPDAVVVATRIVSLGPAANVDWISLEPAK